MNPYYKAWIKYNQGNDPCWKGDMFSGVEYIVWINGQWNTFFHGNRPQHITPVQEQAFMEYLRLNEAEWSSNP